MIKMKHKLATLTITLGLLIGLGAAFEANPQYEEPVEAEPGETIELDVAMENRDEDTAIQDIELTGWSGAEGYELLNVFSVDGGEIMEIRFIAPDHQDSSNITFEFEGERHDEQDDGDDTNIIMVEDEIETHVETENPTFEVFSGWVNQEQEITVGETSYMIDDIEESIFLQRTESEDEDVFEVPQGEHTQLEDVEEPTFIELDTAVPGETIGGEHGVADIRVHSEDEDINVNVSEMEAVDPQECSLDLELGGAASSINRGELNIFYTIDSETGDRVPNVEVVISERDGGSIVEDFVSDDNGRKSLVMPQQIESDEMFFELQYIGDDEVYADCDPNERIVELSQAYEDWLEDEEEFQLDFDLNESMMDDGNLYGNVSGSVANNEGEEVENAVLELEASDGTTETHQVSGTEFNVQPEETGEYEVSVSKSAFLGSSSRTVNYQDQCPDQKGIVEAEGCLEQELNLRVFDSDEETVDTEELQPSEQYIFRMYNDEGEVEEDFEEEMTVRNSDGDRMELPFEQGTARTSFDRGDYRVLFDGTDRYTSISQEVESGSSIIPSINPYLLVAAIFFGALIIGGSAIALSGGSSSSSNRGFSADNKAPSSFTGSSGGASADDLKADLGESGD